MQYITTPSQRLRRLNNSFETETADGGGTDCNSTGLVGHGVTAVARSDCHSRRRRAQLQEAPRRSSFLPPREPTSLLRRWPMHSMMGEGKPFGCTRCMCEPSASTTQMKLLNSEPKCALLDISRVGGHQVGSALGTPDMVR